MAEIESSQGQTIDQKLESVVESLGQKGFSAIAFESARGGRTIAKTGNIFPLSVIDEVLSETSAQTYSALDLDETIDDADIE